MSTVLEVTEAERSKERMRPPSMPYPLRSDEDRDYQRMLWCVWMAQASWSPLGVRELGIDFAAQMEVEP